MMVRMCERTQALPGHCHSHVAPGKHVAYREAGRLYVAALPMTGRSINLSAIENTASGAAAYATERVSAPGGEFIHWSADGTSRHGA